MAKAPYLPGVVLSVFTLLTATAASSAEASPPRISYLDVLAPAPDRPDPQKIAYDAVLDSEASNTVEAARGLPPKSPVFVRASRPIPRGSSALVERLDVDFFDGGKLLLTNGVSSIEGTSGGGIATWATIAGNGMERGIGASTHFTAIELPDFGWRSYGVSVGIADKVELSYARQNFDTRAAGALLGLGEGYTFNQDVYGAKLRLVGDVVYGATMLPQVAVGVEYKKALDGPVLALLGAGDDDGVDYTLSATKLFLEHSLLINTTARLTKANQAGLLGFGSANGGYRIQFEGSLAYQLSRRAVVGAEYRTKPDNLGLGEDDWVDVFAAFAVNEHLTLSAAYVDLGSIATFEDQRGGFVQAQVAF